MNRLVAVLLASLLGFSPVEHQGAPQLTLWQSDLQIRSLTVSEERGSLRARVLVVVESGEAIGARVEILLPVGVGIVMLGPSCRAGPDVTGISDLRARVECSLGNLPAGANRELLIVTTLPPGRVARGFAAVAMSETPDPKPANNFAERVLPQRD